MDPLDSFTALIRSLSRSRAERTAAPSAGAAAGKAPKPAPPPVERTDADLRERLRSRLAALGPASRERRCQAFVETVLLIELSETTGADPQFADLVGRVARELTSDPRVSARLDELLIGLPGTTPP